MIRTLLFLFSLTLIACSEKKDTLFRLVPASESGLDFVNTVEERDTINILTVQYMYHGAGVAIADFNNDGLSDIFFTGNMVPNRLYLNKGGLRFEDVSQKANIDNGKWNAGVAVADINGDGFDDIYVCATINDNPSLRANTLFINQGPDENGIPTFVDEAASYGVADTGYSQNAAFFDYDKDGDLDLYVLTNLESDKIPSNYRPRILDGSALNNDRLYRNNDDKTFTDVTIEAGILIEGYGLGIGVADLNNDSWPDIYIGNDYVSNDILYINNRDGTFTNEINKRLKHQSLSTMGIDIADVNNDNTPDIVTLDMLPENNLRRKTISGAGATYYNYINNREYGYEHQYVRNMLQVNNGDGTFSEVGQMAGIHQTEWSWSSLFMDVDNDGHKDLLITNGYPKDVTDKDYVNFKREVGAFNHHRSLIDSIPVLKVANYAFQNKGDLIFEDQTKNWGMDQRSFSYGAAFADFDNDGDLDYVINNINDPAFLYENTLYNSKSKSANNYLRIKLLARDPKKSTTGTKVIIRHGGQLQYHDHSIHRGYLSTVENTIHFGLGDDQKIDSLTVVWPDGSVQNLFGVISNQVIQLKQVDAKVIQPEEQRPGVPLVSNVSHALNLRFKHKEFDKVDFYRQRTLPHKFSQSGPGIAVGDINGDRLDDFVVGASSDFDPVIFIQQQNGGFTKSTYKKVNRKSEDTGLLLFDADNDGDLDLYVVAGSYEGEGECRYTDQLYVNDGKGDFTVNADALPSTVASGSCVRAADFDNDGDLDLFVGGRVVVGSYPLPAESYLLRNDGGRFTDVTEGFANGLKYAGMITDALWTDADGDDRLDLLLAGEFMPITLFKNTGDALVKTTTGIENFSGWWNSLTAADFDNDGDIDYVAGNLGINNYYNATDIRPLRVYAKDFDGNGSTDAILSCYFKSEKGELEEYPVHFWDELNSQSPRFRKQFSSYKQYGRTTMDQLLAPYDTSEMLQLKMNHPYSSYIENLGSGKFSLRPLPKQSQVAPINGMITTDVNFDGFADIIMVGNDYGNEVFSGRYDSFSGLVLVGDGKGNFSRMPAATTKFKVDGDAKALAMLRTFDGNELLLATQNLDSLKAFKLEKKVQQWFQPNPNDSHAILQTSKGRSVRVEFYYGNGYLSQSSRSIPIPADIVEFIVVDSKGNKRNILNDQLAINP